MKNLFLTLLIAVCFQSCLEDSETPEHSTTQVEVDYGLCENEIIPEGYDECECECIQGQWQCADTECAEDPSFQTEAECALGDSTLAHGENYFDGCNTCSCENGQLMCTAMACFSDTISSDTLPSDSLAPNLPEDDSVPCFSDLDCAPGEECSSETGTPGICQIPFSGCYSAGGTIREHGSSWMEDCNSCSCDDGTILCSEIDCPDSIQYCDAYGGIWLDSNQRIISTVGGFECTCDSTFTRSCRYDFDENMEFCSSDFECGDDEVCWYATKSGKVPAQLGTCATIEEWFGK